MVSWQIGLIGMPWLFAASIFFLFAALFTDLLLIRGALAVAYSCLMVNLLVGAIATETIYVEAWIITAITTLLHVVCMIKMIFDELPVLAFSTRKTASAEPTDEALAEATWRFFRRRGGMRRLAFKSVWARASVERFALPRAGEPPRVICDASSAAQRLYLVVRGCVDIAVTYHGVTSTSVVRSGGFFDLGLFNVFGVNVGFINGGLVATVKRGELGGDAPDGAATPRTRGAAAGGESGAGSGESGGADLPIVLVSWSVEDLDQMATSAYGAVPNGWRSIALYTIASYATLQNAGIAQSLLLAVEKHKRARSRSRSRSRSPNGEASRRGASHSPPPPPLAEGAPAAPDAPDAPVPVPPRALPRMPTPKVWDSNGSCESVTWTFGARSRDFEQWNDIERADLLAAGEDLGAAADAACVSSCCDAVRAAPLSFAKRWLFWALFSINPVTPQGVRHGPAPLDSKGNRGGWVRDLVMQRASAAGRRSKDGSPSPSVSGSPETASPRRAE